MLGAGILVLQLGHLLFRAIEHAAKLIRHPKIDRCASDFWFAIQLSYQPIAQLIRLDADFL